MGSIHRINRALHKEKLNNLKRMEKQRRVATDKTKERSKAKDTTHLTSTS